ncbi:hypothetical protein C8K61_101304 [Pseudomonas sp. GV071]|jgi:hypothetical protein|nr:hypothetical protein C8K61_101304 [Pseudomonas sp. GV071]
MWTCDYAGRRANLTARQCAANAANGPADRADGSANFHARSK